MPVRTSIFPWTGVGRVGRVSRLGSLVGGPLLGGGGLPTIFDYNPVVGGFLPGTSTFARASDAYYFNGSQYVLVGPGVIRDAHVPISQGAPGFLREPVTTNDVIDSDDFTAGSWSSAGLIIGSPAAGPLGLRESVISTDGSASFHRMFASISTLPSSDVTSYFIAKAGATGRFITVSSGNSSADYVVFDLVAGVITETGGVSIGTMTLIDSGYYKCAASEANTSVSNFCILNISNTGTPGNRDPGYGGTGEDIILVQAQYEERPLGLGGFSTTPIVTTGVALTRVADSLTDVDWPVEASAVMDVTVDDPIVLPALGMTMLGFGSGAARIFAVDAPQVLRLFNGGINSFTVAATSYEGERHSYGMSLALNQGIVVDDESNNNTDVTGTPGQGTIYIGSDSILAGQPCTIHRARIYDQTQSIVELEALL